MLFHDRHHAGQLLAEKLLHLQGPDVIVLALPRGGVPVAAEVAVALGAPLEVLIARKIGAPFQPELAVGAICEDGPPHWNEDTLASLGLRSKDLELILESEREKISRQTHIFRSGRALPSLAEKLVILVDDGLATGATMTAAVRYLKHHGVDRIVIAVPVAAESSVRSLVREVEQVVVGTSCWGLESVGQWYEDFSQVSDDEVVSLLSKLREHEGTLHSVKIPVGELSLEGDLRTPPQMKALIVFVHGSGSSRKSPRNQMVARRLNQDGFGTLLFDLLSEPESQNRQNVFDINLLSERLLAVTHWIHGRPELRQLPLGFFGASTGAAAAIEAASLLGDTHAPFAIVSRGGRPDLAGAALERVQAPTLLLVGGLDYDVLELNRRAQKSMPQAELRIIPGASHVFEEPGTLEEVAEQSSQWFEEQLEPTERVHAPLTRTLPEALESQMIPLKRESDFDSLIDSIKDARVVMLGESSHGTQEFYRLRRLISQKLIEDHGFKFIAVEGDWPDAYRVNEFIQSGKGGSARNVLMQNHRWPTWMWANTEIEELVEWMRGRGAGFYGLDVYSLFASITEVLRYLKKHDPQVAHEVEQKYACFEPYRGDEIAYARSLLQYAPGCEGEVIHNLETLLKMRVQHQAEDGNELFGAQQNARTVAKAEAYYRAMLQGDASSWNVRDGHMMETLDRLLERSGETAKAIVWAHNTHIGDYRATDMQAGGYVNLGGLARENYADENVALVGFGTYEGQVLAGLAWDGPEEVMPLPPAQEESYERFFHEAAVRRGVEQFYVLLEDKTHTPFARRLGHRAVGVVYDPRHERPGHYVPTVLSKRYDAFVFVDRSTALKSLHAHAKPRRFPETWPMGQ